MEKDCFVGAFEVFDLGPVVEGNEVGDCAYLEGSWSVTDLGGVAGSEDQVWVFVGLGSAFEGWLDTHARWAAWTPEVDDEAWAFFDQLLDV